MTQIVFDIGGTNTRVATIVNGTLGDIEKFPTDEDPNVGLSNVATHAHVLLNDELPTGVCGCVAGGVVGGVVLGANNLLFWNGVPIAETLENTLGIPVTVLNDAELAGIGEYTFGAGKGYHSLLYVTVSTGIGKARIVNGVVVTEADMLKFSHELVEQLDLEHTVSGTAIKNLYGIDPRELDETVRMELAEHLAHGLVNSVINFAPECIVLGGAMILGTLNPIPFDIFERELAASLTSRDAPVPIIKKAALGDNSGLYGAMAYLEQR